MKMMQRLSQVLVVTAMVLITNTSPSRAARVLLFRRFHVKIGNRLDNGERAQVKCNWGLHGVHVLAQGEAVDFRFRVGIFKKRIPCNALKGEGKFTLDFDAFEASHSFVDNTCEGRWCIWNLWNEGVNSSRGTRFVPWHKRVQI